MKMINTDYLDMTNYNKPHKMDASSHISLIDLSKQFPFEIDNQLKKEISFGETLIISCGHQDGNIIEESLDSELSCDESIESKVSKIVKEDTVSEVKDSVEEEAIDKNNTQISEEDNDFHFYFFPNCNITVSSRNSQASIITVDGLPQINPVIKDQIYCTCKVDKKGKCECYVKLACECDTETIGTHCVCSKLEKICVYHDGKSQPKCTCKGNDVCHSDGLYQPICICAAIDKPCDCISNPEKFPSADISSTVNDESNDNEEENKVNEVDEKKKIELDTKQNKPYEYQEVQSRMFCQSLKIKECICKESTCICNENTCICEVTSSQRLICKADDSKAICNCSISPECKCVTNSLGDCACFQNTLCTCGEPEKCKCFISCDCTAPCLCDTKNESEECLDNIKVPVEPHCTNLDKIEERRKFKPVRADKHGYRCHDVDPRHTFFDYGYGRHDNISHEVKEQENIKILDFCNEDREEENSVHEEIATPQYKKKIKKPSLDCCSAVGGISISVEVLGEDQDKFLVQTVSHSSKEGAKTGSKLVSIIDCNLHTMEENRTEYITKKDITKEHRNYMTICESGYYNKVTRICGERNIVKRFYHTFEDAHDFLLEGANVVILRYIGLRRYRGNVKTKTVLMDGTICQSVYACSGVSQAIVNGKPLFVVKVERHIIEPSGYIHQTLTVLTLRGYIVSHEWSDNNYILHLNPLLRVVPEKDEIEHHAPLRESWRQDLQLLSDYLDFKSARSSEGTRYARENDSLSGTIRDYLQALLLLKPQDALHFTRHYFREVLSALDLPHNEYFDSASKRVKYYFFEE